MHVNLSRRCSVNITHFKFNPFVGRYDTFIQSSQVSQTGLFVAMDRDGPASWVWYFGYGHGG